MERDRETVILKKSIVSGSAKDAPGLLLFVFPVPLVVEV